MAYNTFETIANKFPISNEEYRELDAKFGNLVYFAVWQLKKKNNKNLDTNDPEDDIQSLRISLLRAGSYYKRQLYIEKCFLALDLYVKDLFIKKIVDELRFLWTERRRHGANRQKFGEYQEQILEILVQGCVPISGRPDPLDKLTIDAKFGIYCKSIIWNEQKALGKKISKEKGIRASMVSLSEFDYLGVV